MIEYTPIIAYAVPSLISGGIAYLIGQRKSKSAAQIAKSKFDAEIQTQALSIVKSVILDLKTEFLREIGELKTKIVELTSENEKLKLSIENLDNQLVSSGKLSETLQSEITSLQRNLTAYKEENDRLKQK